ncbi:hypothetical protein [Acinetobacter baumannii]|uniref:hypothetical protein n=1 Tax=Acinetobacter baumannii TaxID=470 RepID=UPI000303B20C|nr:hypothetical protein [Acinetobacter baumannii]EKT8003146.1 hypothetical protein [Acinetobacter baumannii]EKU1732445.1 hypothetical protein [Acinetobacter baumannii]EKV2313471.1 hypothetical protein [Acinetobacter baumannii]EKV2433982.1 hypothetical protein [Acinetobacter baumannii]EKV2438303.1 hypothetical protein [Acinetobacter baumannii]
MHYPFPDLSDIHAKESRRKRASEYLPFLAELYKGAVMASDEELKADVREKILKHLKNI